MAWSKPVAITGSADTVQHLVKGFSTQTANLAEWRTSAGTLLWYITGAGILISVATNIATDTTTGMKIGTGTTQKIGFWNATPVVQQANTVAIDTLLVTLGLRASGGVGLFDTDIKAGVVGKGIYVKEGSNATMGVATLVGGTVTVSTTKVTANSRIQLTPQTLGTILRPVGVGVTARTAGTSFTITSMDITDTSDVAWVIYEPA